LQSDHETEHGTENKIITQAKEVLQSEVVDQKSIDNSLVNRV